MGGATLKSIAATTVLHVEDDDATALLVKLALTEAKAELRYLRATNVDAAIQVLSMNSVTESTTARPSLILLDLNLPRRGGFELLTYIRSAEELANLRVVILTSSSASDDRKRATALGADGYITKASTFDEYVAQLSVLVNDV